MLGNAKYLILFLIGCTPRSGDYVTVQCPELRSQPVLCQPCVSKICPDCNTYLDLYTKGSSKLEACEDARDGLKEEVRRAKENEEFWKRQYDESHCTSSSYSD